MTVERHFLRIEQFPDAPEWHKLRVDVTSWCEQTRLNLLAELNQYEKGTPDWEATMGAIEFCEEVPSILEKSPDWSSARYSVVRASGGVRLLATPTQRLRHRGRSSVRNHVMLSLKTGILMKFHWPRERPW